MGWKNITLGIGQNARWTDNFYSNLSIGYTVSDAALFATLTFPELGPVSEQLPGAAFVRPIFPQIWGDSGTKMHGVYSGNGTGYDITWFKPL